MQLCAADILLEPPKGTSPRACCIRDALALASLGAVLKYVEVWLHLAFSLFPVVSRADSAEEADAKH